MSDEDLEKPGQEVLDDAITDAITRTLKEWPLTIYEVVGPHRPRRPASA